MTLAMSERYTPSLHRPNLISIIH